MDEMVRKIFVICDKLYDAFLEGRRSKLIDLREGKVRTKRRENFGVRDGVVEEDDVSGGN